VKVIADDRPTPNNLEFERILLEDCVLGADLPPSALYHVAKMGGPDVRFSMEEVRRWILIEHREQAQRCARFWAFFIAKEIKAGRLRPPVGRNGKPEKYWNKVQWIGLPDMTIDKGREGGLSITRLQAGLTTWADEWAAQGQFGASKISSQIRAFAEAKAEAREISKEVGIEVTLPEVFPSFGGPTATAPMDEPEGDEEIDPNDETDPDDEPPNTDK